MEDVRAWLARRVFSPLQGVTFGPWRRFLRERGLRPDRAYLPRAILTDLAALANSVHARREERRFGEAVANAQPGDPIFVLGHYRGGTTYLQYLLSLDPRLTFPNYYQCNFPRTFLTTERLGARLFAGLTPRRRPHDNVEIRLGLPAEDELALSSMTFLSPHLCWHFPCHMDEFRRFLTFEQASGREREAARDALVRFVSKLAVASPGRPAVLKSPCHTARIPLLLEAFPGARFIHIHRHPLDVYRSTVHMERKVRPLFRYQHDDPGGIDEFVLWRYRAMGEAFLAARPGIPEGRFAETSFARLAGDPVGTLRRIYEILDLPSFDDDARARVDAYLKQHAGYRRNHHPDLDEATRRRVVKSWGRFFDAWEYEPVDRRVERLA